MTLGNGTEHLTSGSVGIVSIGNGNKLLINIGTPHVYVRICSNVSSVWYPDSKVHGANMGPTWVLSAPDGPILSPCSLLSGNSTAGLPPLSPLAVTGTCGPLCPEQLPRPYMGPVH